MKKKLVITKRALIQRINRKLAQGNPPEQLKTARGDRQREAVGDYFIRECGYGRSLVQEFVSLEKLGKKLGVLAPYEELERAAR